MPKRDIKKTRRTVMRTENISPVDSDHSRYKARERSSVFAARDLNREFQLVYSRLTFQHRFSVTENICLVDSDHSRCKGRERSLVLPARDLSREFFLVYSRLAFHRSITHRKGMKCQNLTSKISDYDIHFLPGRGTAAVHRRNVRSFFFSRTRVVTVQLYLSSCRRERDGNKQISIKILVVYDNIIQIGL